MYCKKNQGASDPRLGGDRVATLQRLQPLIRTDGSGEALRGCEALGGGAGCKLDADPAAGAATVACAHHESNSAKESAGWSNSEQCMVAIP